MCHLEVTGPSSDVRSTRWRLEHYLVASHIEDLFSLVVFDFEDVDVVLIELDFTLQVLAIPQVKQSEFVCYVWDVLNNLEYTSIVDRHAGEGEHLLRIQANRRAVGLRHNHWEV